MPNTEKDISKNEAGAEFARALERSGLKPADISRYVGGYGQQINNWKRRGVPARYAVVVAAKIGSSPELISPEYVAYKDTTNEPSADYEANDSGKIDFSIFTKGELTQAIKMAMDELPAEERKLLLRHLVDSF